MSGGGLIRLLAQRLAGGAAKEAETPVLREVLARRLGRASDGSILPVREPEPFSNSLRGSNNDLMDAAGMSPSRPLPDAGSVQGGNATLYRGSNTGGRRGRWMTPDRQAAGDYGQVSSASQDVRGALEISDFGDLEVALGDKAAVLRRMDADNADVWDALEEPSVQAALRENGHRVVRLSDDVSPTGRRHESYLFLDESRAETGPTTARAGGEGAQVVPPPAEGRRRLYNASTADRDPQGYLDPHVSGWVEEVAAGAGDFDDLSQITRPLVYMGDNPQGWIRMIVGRKIGKHPTEVSIEDIRQHGRLNIVDADPEYDNIFQVGEFGRDESVTTLGGERRKLWDTNLYDSDEFTEMPVGPEPNDFISREPVQVTRSLVGDDLVRFLEQNPARPLPDGGPLQRALRDRMQRE